MLDALEPLFSGALTDPGVSVRMPLSGGLEVCLADGWRVQSGCSRQPQHIKMPPEGMICIMRQRASVSMPALQRS